MARRPAADPRGNARESKDKQVEVFESGVKPSDRIPAMPENLGPKGAVTWQRIWAAARRVYNNADSETLERYCRKLDDYWELYEQVDGNYFTVDRFGIKQISPEFKVLRELERDLLRYEELLGFTPESRARLGILSAGDPDAGALEEFIGSV